MRILNIALGISLLFSSCNKDAFKLQNGDLLFQDIDCGPLCDAIEQVTSGIEGAHFSHIGMIIEVSDSIWVVEAIYDKVKITRLSEFLNRSFDERNNPKVWVGRLKPKFRKFIPKAVQKSKEYIGIEYDESFLPDNNKLYCSELVCLCFSEASNQPDFFPTTPMTFLDTTTKKTFPSWEEYYQKLEIPVPEGIPGTNPGGISISDKIEIVFKFGNPSGLIRQ